MELSSDRIQMSHMIKKTDVLGPGKRFVLWVQGCKKRCKNCINPEGQALEGGQFISVEEIFDIICEQREIQGITISGGEPFLQFPAIFKLVMLVKEYTNLDIMLFSGYTYEEIKCQYSEKMLDLFFDKIDIFVDGEYIDSLNNNQMFRGSENQNIYFFTEKYRAFKDQIICAKNRNIEFQVERDSDIFLVGIPPKNFYKELINSVKNNFINKDRQ